MSDPTQPGRSVDSGTKGFDPRPYLRRIERRGRQAEYLDVKWRLVWLRTEHPDAHITTEHVTLTDDLAVFRATVEIPGGGTATGYGSESRADFPEFIETAETKAIGRALAALGYGTQFVTDFEIGSDVDDEPEPIADAPVEGLIPDEDEWSEAESLPTEFESERPDNVRDLPRPERLAAREEPVETAREPFDPADYSWNDFWRWARSLGYRDRGHVATLLGRELGDLTPHEVRRLLLQYRQEQGDE